MSGWALLIIDYWNTLNAKTFNFCNCFLTVPPHIIGDGIHDLTLKKGRPIRYDIWFGGEPAPNVEWIREGRTLANDDATSLELYCKNTIYTERNTVLSIPKVCTPFQIFNFYPNKFPTTTFLTFPCSYISLIMREKLKYHRVSENINSVNIDFYWFFCINIVKKSQLPYYAKGPFI